jgi:hypothetical protein
MIRKIRNAGALAAVAAVAFMLTQFGASILRAQVTGILPFATGVTVQNSVTTIIGPNPSRRGLKICNVGATNDVWIAPVNPAGATPVTPAALGAGSFLLSRNSAAGANVTNTCLNTPGDVAGGANIPIVATAGFAGITNAATSPVTVWEY